MKRTYLFPELQLFLCLSYITKLFLLQASFCDGGSCSEES